MVTQNDNSARGVEVGALLSTEETRKLWKEYQAGTLDKWMYGDLPLGWSQVVSKAQAVLTLKEVGEWIVADNRDYWTGFGHNYPSDRVVHLVQALLKGKLPDRGVTGSPPGQ